MTISTGIGYDAHRFADEAAERLLILGGVEVEGGRGLEAWSDGDVLTHAIIDALLGAAALGDIGTHYPDTDERWRDADSLDLLRSVVELLGTEGWAVVHVDATVVLEAPRLAPHRDAILAALGAVLGSVSLKATTGEGLGFVGRQEGVAALAVATLSLP